VLALAITLPLAVGCSYLPGPSASYPASSAEVKAEWSRMVDEPTGLARPLVVIDGWLPLGGGHIAAQMRRLTGASRDEVLVVSYGPGARLERIAELVVRRVEERWPSESPTLTREVDVIGFSAGGIVGRIAALPAEAPFDRKRLDVARMFTISAPHRGTIGYARWLAIDAASRQMRPGSALLGRLDAAQADAAYELVCYGQLHDGIVGARHTAPPGLEPIWTPGLLLLSHSKSARNRRFLADIALRLRGEAPLAGEPLPPPRN
jgi:hypothetical protein